VTVGVEVAVAVGVCVGVSVGVGDAGKSSPVGGVEVGDGISSTLVTTVSVTVTVSTVALSPFSFLFPGTAINGRARKTNVPTESALNEDSETLRRKNTKGARL
jgi:hypothetical protein